MKWVGDNLVVLAGGSGMSVSVSVSVTIPRVAETLSVGEDDRII